MRKFRFRAYLDQALFVLLIMAGATVLAMLDVRAVAGAMAAGKLGLGPAIAASAPAPARPPVASAASAAQAPQGSTIVAELAQ